MAKFYTHASLFGSDVLLRGFEGGKRFSYKIPLKPYLFIPSKKEDAVYRTLDGCKVDKIEFESPREARNFVQKYEDVHGFTFYGMTKFLYPFLNDFFPGKIEYDTRLVNVGIIDIEVAADQGFPDIQMATKEVTAITLRVGGQIFVFGCGDFKYKDENIRYFKCKDEIEILLKFLDVWRSCDLDIITGWNIEFFDIPYLVNRITNVLNADHAKSLSPYSILYESVVEINGRENQVFLPVGIAVLDYINLYKKFTPNQKESYRLDAIAQEEEVGKKVDYTAYGNLLDLYKNNYQMFIEYNIHDVNLVALLDEKLGYLNQVMGLAYDAKITYNDTLTTVGMWDAIIHNYLLDQRIVVPQVSTQHVKDNYIIAGGHVKEPKVGMYKWVVNLDLNSLYPHLIMHYNIGPETLVDQLQKYRVWTQPYSPPSEVGLFTIDDYVNERIDLRERLINEDAGLTPTGCLFRRGKRGFLSSLMNRIYNDRIEYKDRMIKAKKEYEKTHDEKLIPIIAQNNNVQYAKKIQMNSCYGALANKYFRWYDQRLAESITLGGQLSIKWIEKKINEYLNNVLDTANYDYVIAIDTDSIYLTLDKLVQKVLPDAEPAAIVDFLDKVAKTKLEKLIDKWYEELAVYMNAAEQRMGMKRENIADKAIWTGKKRYIMNVWDSEGVRYDQPKLKITGIEAVRSSTPAACRTAIKDTLKIIMNTDEVTTQKVIADFREKFSTMKFEEIAFPRGVNGVDKYAMTGERRFADKTPIHVRGSLIYNKLIRDLKLENKLKPIYNGDKIKFCYLKMPNPTHQDVIAVHDELPQQFGLHSYIDYELQFTKAYLEPIRKILAAINWSDEKRATLEDFWK